VYNNGHLIHIACSVRRNNCSNGGNSNDGSSIERPTIESSDGSSSDGSLLTLVSAIIVSLGKIALAVAFSSYISAERSRA